jgi:hypothetical protein
MKNQIRIGCGAGFSGDRIEPAVVLAEKGELDYLVLECLAERTIALAQKRKLANPDLGYDPLLEKRIMSLLPFLAKNNIVLISNMGAANPIAAAKKIKELAINNGFDLKIAAVTGDDVLEKLDLEEKTIENEKPLKNIGEIVSANAYIGVDGILEALKQKAQIIITGRVADPSLFLAPMIHEFGWSMQDSDLLGKGTIIGHLMECAGQVTGGYFAEPGKKEVAGLENLGHPFADVQEDGTATISKVNDTGGMVNLQTMKEQLLYEVINPHAYLTPDVAADFTSVTFTDLGNDRVQVKKGSGNEKPSKLKVSVGYKAFIKGEGEISYAGTGALERAKLASEIIKKRLRGVFDELQLDLLGINSLHKSQFENNSIPYEIRLRVSARTKDEETAALVGEEVEALYTNGPAGGGGVRKSVSEVIGVLSVLIDRNTVEIKTHIF